MKIALPPTPAPQTGRTRLEAAELRRQAESFEEAFLGEMLKAVGTARPAQEMGGGIGEEQFASFLATAQAQAIMSAGGIGLTARIEAALSRN